MREDRYHIPVLAKTAIDLLVSNTDGSYLDCTLGGGGHSAEILSRLSEKGFLIGLDKDITAVEYAKKRLSEYKNFKAVNISFDKINELDEIVFGTKFDGILFDLGVSSEQINDPARGFSYSQSGDLDMRMDSQDNITAFDIINNYPEEDLADIFFRYGEERKSRRIAKKIAEARKDNRIRTTKELASIIASAVPSNFKVKSLSRIFQAVRIEVNKEMDQLAAALEQSLDILKSKGRAAVISYHSLEDRMVKQFINSKSAGCICPSDFPKCVCNNRPVINKITKKVVIPENGEIKKNPRSRSAKLRVYEKI
ncbi:MAG: 16S rRNA (cytosine(1402)-N(4))-methyltransferase RsmH [Candidatus Delongbacteria bacterium]